MAKLTPKQGNLPDNDCPGGMRCRDCADDRGHTPREGQQGRGSMMGMGQMGRPDSRAGTMPVLDDGEMD